MKLAIPAILLAYLLVGAGETWLHRFAGEDNTPAAHALKEWYLYQYPNSGKFPHIWMLDELFPIIVLGLTAGGMTADKPQNAMIWSAFVLAAGIITLIPLYATFFSDEPRYWWFHATRVERTGALIVRYFWVALLCLFFGGVGRGVARQIQGRAQDI